MSSSENEMCCDNEDSFQLVRKNKKKRHRDHGSSEEIEVRKSKHMSSDKELVSTPVENLVTVVVTCKTINLGMASPVAIAKWLEQAVSDVENVKAISNGLRIRTTDSKVKAMKMHLKTYKKEAVSFQVQENKTKIKGVLYRVPQNVTQNDFEDLLYVEKAEKVYKGSSPTGTVFVTFSKYQKTVPESIKVGYLNFKVHQFIPQPLRCYKCQRFGHTATSCHGKERCVKCGGEHKEDICPQENQKCCNCGGDHRANSKECEKYQQEKKTLQIKTEQKISYAQAAKQVRNQAELSTPQNRVSVRSVGSTQPPGSASQADTGGSDGSRAVASGLTVSDIQLVTILIKLFFMLKKEVFVKENRVEQIVEIGSKLGNMTINKKEIQQMIEEHFPSKGK